MLWTIRQTKLTFRALALRQGDSELVNFTLFSVGIIHSRVACFVFHHSSFHKYGGRAIPSAFGQKVYTTSLLHYDSPSNQFTQYSIRYYPLRGACFLFYQSSFHELGGCAISSDLLPKRLRH